LTIIPLQRATISPSVTSILLSAANGMLQKLPVRIGALDASVLVIQVDHRAHIVDAFFAVLANVHLLTSGRCIY
jgi:hypothetical protein